MDRQLQTVLAKIERRLAAIEKLLREGDRPEAKRGTRQGLLDLTKKLNVRKYV